jgi:hypothetical protein
LADVARDVFADRARDEIDAAAGRERHDETHRPVRPRRLLRAYRRHAEQSTRAERRSHCCRALEKIPSPDLGHFILHLFRCAALLGWISPRFRDDSLAGQAGNGSKGTYGETVLSTNSAKLRHP